MKNKGFITVFAVLLILVSLFYLSFSFVSSYYTGKAEEYAKGDPKLEEQYLDSIADQKVWLGSYTLKECREMGIGLGLDLKGGMNVVLEVSVGDILKSLADHTTDATFNKAIANATKAKESSQSDFIRLFIDEYRKLAPGKSLASVFATQQMRDKVSQQSSDAEVEKALRTEVQAAIDNSYNVLRTRIDRFGVVQPNIQALENRMGRIMVELPGIKEPERVRRLLQGSANLEFWETYEASEILPYLTSVDNLVRSLRSNTSATDTTQVAETPAADSAATAADLQSSKLASMLKSGSATDKTAEISADKAAEEHPLLYYLQPASGQRGCILGYSKDTAEVNKCFAMPEVQKILPRDLRLKWSVKASEFDPTGKIYELYAIKSTDRSGRAPLEGDVVVDAKSDFNQTGQQIVSMAMNSEGARLWAQLTKKNIGRCVAIVLDNYVYSAPVVNNEITGGRSEISGNFTPEEAKDLANVLRSGKMPAPAHIVQEEVIGPTLGQESVQQGIISCVIAIILLMIYMCSMYGFAPGMIANGAFLLNFFFTLGILTSFQAALTMSGIAGMVLSLGMAVDANVLIYERAKEELRAGKGLRDALKDGYNNAFSAIFDSNVTSIITGIILFYFGTGTIRGFATTLIIGIGCSFFTAVFLTRLAYEYFFSKGKLLNLNFKGISKDFLVNAHYKFIENSRRSLTIFGIFIAIFVVSFAVNKLNPSIDFTGGRNYVVQFENPVTVEDVRDCLTENVGSEAFNSVLAIGTDGHKVRISTNYLINENGPEVDSQLEAMLYKGLKPLLTGNISLEQFTNRDDYTGGTILSSEKVGPSMADDMKRDAVWAVIFAVIGIGLYILIRFRNVAYSIASTIALMVDTILVLGIYSLCWKFMPFSMEIDQTFIGAILTVVGYSINDKVVIFDRVREYFGLYPKRNNLQIFNDSLNSTLSRTLNTGTSTLVVLFCIFVLGGESIRSFSFALIMGVCIGTLTSIFLAAPLAYYLLGRKENKKKEA